MRSTVFQFPLEKVVRCTKGALRHMGLKIVSYNAFEGKIKAASSFSLLKPSITVDLDIEELENHNIKVTINGLAAKHHFFQKKEKDPEFSEAEILEKVSTLL